MASEFSKALSLALKEKGLTQARYADEVGLSPGAVSMLLCGSIKPRDSSLKNIIEPFGGDRALQAQIVRARLADIAAEAGFDGAAVELRPDSSARDILASKVRRHMEKSPEFSELMDALISIVDKASESGKTARRHFQARG